MEWQTIRDYTQIASEFDILEILVVEFLIIVMVYCSMFTRCVQCALFIA